MRKLLTSIAILGLPLMASADSYLGNGGTNFGGTVGGYIA